MPTNDPSPLNATAKSPVHFPSLSSQESNMSTSEYDLQGSLLSRQTSYSTESSARLSTSKKSFTARTSSGKTISIEKKPPWKAVIREQEKRTEARAQKEAYYGVDIHGLLNNIEDQPSQPFEPRFPSISLVPIANNRHNKSGSISPCQDLWTDKYRATKFVDLLGDERIHRDVMRWLKHWDFCVFGRDIPKSSSYHSNYSNASKNGKPTFGGNAPVVMDPYQRPTRRILMLHGPPGLGKTTVAHVAATLAGYEVLEINASDERTGTAARERIVEAVETVGLDRSGRRGKERCVILDECDGGDTVVNPTLD